MDKVIIFAEKYGVCAGVKNALSIVDKELTKNNNNIYVFHEIVHNSFVIKNLEKQGVIFTEDFSTVPDRATLIFSAHGVSKDIEKIAESKNLKVIDGTCPLVKKNHKIIEDAELRGDYVLFIGDRNHAEVIGSVGRMADKSKIFLISTNDDIENLPELTGNMIVLSQTTLSASDVKEKTDLIKQKFPQVVNCGGICHATDSRQNAIKKLAQECDLILVAGSPKSANSRQLATIASSFGVPTYLIETPQDLKTIDFSQTKKIGISAGASTPQEQIDLIINELMN